MKNKDTRCGEERFREENPVKGTFYFIKDFAPYWKKRDEDFLKEHPIITLEEAENYRKTLIQKISSEFKEGDRIIHFDYYGIATPRCESEYLLIKRDDKIIKSITIRMS